MSDGSKFLRDVHAYFDKAAAFTTHNLQVDRHPAQRHRACGAVRFTGQLSFERSAVQRDLAPVLAGAARAQDQAKGQAGHDGRVISSHGVIIPISDGLRF